MTLIFLQKKLLSLLILVAASFSAAQTSVYDENRVLSAQHLEYFDQIAKELYTKTGITLTATLVDDAGFKKWNETYCGNDSIKIIIAFKQQWHFVKTDSALATIWNHQQIARVQQETLLPAFRRAKYGQGILLLAYELAKRTTEQKGLNFSTEPLELEDNQSISLGGWFFVLVVFGLVFGAARKSLGIHSTQNKPKGKSIGFNGKFGHKSNFGNG